MQEIKRYQVRGVPGQVIRHSFDGRIVDSWVPKGGAQRLLIAHDGQNVFDGKTSTHRGQTWKMAQAALGVSKDLSIEPPAIIAVWHSSTKADPWGRARDLVPEKYFQGGIPVPEKYADVFNPSMLQGDQYLEKIFSEYIPQLVPNILPQNTAMIGSSMGALATLYAVAQMPDRFHTALALSPHWPFGEDLMVHKTVSSLPNPGNHKVWMSHGTKGIDRDYAPYQGLADRLMKEKGYDSSNFLSRVYQRSGHNERSWAKYLDQPLRFWLDI